MHECNNLSSAARHLRNLADEFEQILKSVQMPQQEYTPTEALQKMATVVDNETYLTVDMPSFNWHRRKDPVQVGNWQVYDGKDHFGGKTLAEAVNKMLAVHQPPAPADTVENVENVLAGCEKLPF